MQTVKIVISGQVQGVGFRPFVFNLAEMLDVNGTVSNNEEGVIIFAQASKEIVDSFYKALLKEAPILSKIDKHYITEVNHKKFKDFKIIPSENASGLNLQLTPDFGICDKCKNEINDPKNARYNYPFTTCVHCGPRWAITKTFPFERHHTSIDEFKMCQACENEYSDPRNRRFHSQTNSCGECGIQLKLIDNESELVSTNNALIFNTIHRLLIEESIIAIKNTSGFLLCCDARNDNVVRKLRQKKNRPEKPFALLYPSVEKLKTHFSINLDIEKELTAVERPIVIIPTSIKNKTPIASSVAPGLNQLGVMLPNSPLLQLLANEIDFPIVATSGNISGSPVLSDNLEALELLGSIADYFLLHNLKIEHPQDDSVIKVSNNSNERVLFRRSRGFAPNYYAPKIENKKNVMAMGAHLKSTISYMPNDYIYISQYLGHLDNYGVYERFGKESSSFMNIFQQKPAVVLVDKHPSYQSTLFGKELAESIGAEFQEIQHHKAHFASILAEHSLFTSPKEILGVVWDGTGFGNDHQIWGGEFFKYHNGKMQRIAHFDYYDWLAGDKMAKEPRLSLFSLVDEVASIMTKKFNPKETKIYKELKKKNKLKTSSVGRLFDAVASLLDICDINTYEGEAAIKLENHVLGYDLKKCNSYASVFGNDHLSANAIINGVQSDIDSGIEKPQIICNFLFTLAKLIIDVANHNGIKSIACSGGVFQNTVLLDMLKEIAGNEYELFFNRNLSPNDENISLGQIMYYLNGVDS
ncbi:carbamoyltransferase HypF [Winogradskyella vincentii]|uniref:Carbamoyltransferase n=1 Tax=Winogradskyella vincentii TaxID=2877122 RepID=A0ABS7Y3C4_9FLAO|nr:carbamoyltransferase HypF [Winogradskyella vincentii]MCA0153357.1 carbamoyltransferase HypF [Winogradskyella vincentii]